MNNSKKDLSIKDLSIMDLSKKDLSVIDLSKIDLSKKDLSKIKKDLSKNDWSGCGNLKRFPLIDDKDLVDFSEEEKSWFRKKENEARTKKEKAEEAGEDYNVYWI